MAIYSVVEMHEAAKVAEELNDASAVVVLTNTQVVFIQK